MPPLKYKIMNTLKEIYYWFIRTYRILIVKICYEGKKETENQQKLKDLKNKFLGKRIFIVCTGPSLKADDLQKIHENGDCSFSCNKVTKIFTQTDWRPTFYTVMDGGYQYTLLDNMKEASSLYKFFRKESYSTTRKAGGNILWLKSDGRKELLDNPKFSEDASEIIYTIGTVTYTMLQLSVYMGFKEIYIIGCDNSYASVLNKDGSLSRNGETSYFYGADDRIKSNIPIEVWQMDCGYYYARKYADEHGIKIYNATRGGYLEAFERVDFDSLFN